MKLRYIIISVLLLTACVAGISTVTPTTTIVPTTTTTAITTTTAVTTTTVQPVSTVVFRNSNPIYNRFENVPADQINLRDLIIDGTPDFQWFKSNAFNPPTGVNGQFRTRCELSHLSYDDPIMKPGQPGKSHLHMYYGNTKVDAYSTENSIINSGGSTCDGFELNRTAYWFPVLLDSSGKARIPNNMMLYYKGEGVTPPAEGYSDMPPGLKMIAGNPMATTPQRPADNFGWACGNMFTNPSIVLIPNDCTGKIMLKVAFPRCWNGRTDFDSPDATSFVVYASNGPSGGICPASHPKVFTGLTALFDWDVVGSTAGWKLASDGQLPGGTTTHGDWFGGWNKDVMHSWTKECVTAEWNCQTSFIGKVNLIEGAPGTVNQLAPTRLVYLDKGPTLVDINK